MTTYRIANEHNGAYYGTFQGDDEAAALASMHRDAGYDVMSRNGELVFPDEETAELCGGLADWLVTEVEAGQVTEDEIRELCVLTTRDGAGRHFTEYADRWQALEAAGMIGVHRPVHEQTGIPYDQDHWSLEITEAGQDLIDANEELHPEAER